MANRRDRLLRADVATTAREPSHAIPRDTCLDVDLVPCHIRVRMHKRVRLETVANVTLAAAAVAMVFLVAWRRLTPALAPASAQSSARIAQAEWAQLLHLAGLDASLSKPAMIVFVDVECPFCARYDETVTRLHSELGSDLSIGFVHYPLSQHRFAMQGALALECTPQFRTAEPVLVGSVRSSRLDRAASVVGTGSSRRSARRDTNGCVRVTRGAPRGRRFWPRHCTSVVHPWNALRPDRRTPVLKAADSIRGGRPRPRQEERKS